MAPDSFKNLGFGDDADAPAQARSTATATPSQQQLRPQAGDTPDAS
jgi:cytochrome c oxidase assembly protein subunit 19